MTYAPFRFIIEINSNLDIVQRIEQNQTFLTIYPLPALLTPLPHIPFTTEEITSCTNEAAIGANRTPRNPPSSFLFHLLLFQ